MEEVGFLRVIDPMASFQAVGLVVEVGLVSTKERFVAIESTAIWMTLERDKLLPCVYLSMIETDWGLRYT